MAKPLTEESLDTKPEFTVKLDVKTHKNLIRYLLLTENPTGRNAFINNAIEKELEGKLLTNRFIDLQHKQYFFNLNDLLKHKTVIATPNPILHNQNEIYVVRQVPNNLDDFNKDLKTYCVGNNKNVHAGYYILPAYKEYGEKHFTFRYDAEKEEIEINLVPPTDINTLFNPLDEKKQEIKKQLLCTNIYRREQLKQNNFNSIDILRELNVMYNYKLNLELLKLKNEEENAEEKTESLTDEEKAEREKIYFAAVFF